MEIMLAKIIFNIFVAITSLGTTVVWQVECNEKICTHTVLSIFRKI
jgi:hypothetical protein